MNEAIQNDLHPLSTRSASLNPQKESVRKYYLASTEDYLKYYETDWHHHMHYGFERDLPKGGNPTENLVKYLADCAEFSEGDRIADAGCGVGGSSLWLAQNRGCKPIGLNLMEFQLRMAGKFAKVLPEGQRPTYATADFISPPIKDESLDGIWGVESFDHAPDKALCLKAWAPLLKPGGRIALADGFRAERTFSPKENHAYREFLAGWAVPNLCSAKEMHTFAESAGLRVVRDEDITADVMPHAKAIFRFGLIFIPIRAFLKKLGLTSAEKLGNAVATYHQYHTLKQGLWSYRIVILEKVI
jgi:SAM-dependent methyltransferase